jgi:curved DNA-binding protein CbpA
MDHYETLGVDKDSTPEDIKKAYRRQAMKHHPDRDGGDGDKFHAIERAYNTLSDPGSRAHYDATGESDQPNQDDLASARVAALFDLLIEKGATGDLVEIAVVNVQRSTEEFENQRHKARTKLERMKRRAGRVKAKTGVNLFEQVIQRKIKACQRELTAMETEIEINGKVLEILANYQDEAPDQLIVRDSFAKFGSGTTFGGL